MVLETEDADALVGQTIGARFTITRLIAKGGMAVVYEAEQRLGTTTRKVALKTLRIQSLSDPSMAARFKRECETIAQLSHPNTVRVYDFGETDDGLLYIAMEFVAGKPLSQIMDEAGPMPAPRVLGIMRQITGALEEAHAEGIVHRDLKPDNVAIQLLGNQEDGVKLLDFGIAVRSVGVQNYGKLTRAGIVLGTPPYMSPEQFTPDPIDARSDVYALGVMAYEMLTSHLPLEADTPWAWAVAHQTAQPVPFEIVKPALEIPRPMRQAILRALSKSRDERQTSAKQFFEELSAPSNTSPMDAPPTFQPVMGTTPMPAVAAASSGVGPSAVAATQGVPSYAAPIHIGPGSVAVPGSIAVPGAYAATSMTPRRPSRWPVYLLATIVVLLAGGLVVLGRPFLFPEEDPPPPFPSAPQALTQGSPDTPKADDEDTDEPVKPRRSPKPVNNPPVVNPKPPAPPTPSAAPSQPAEPAPSASAPTTSPPPTGVLQCQSDAQCGFNRCDIQVNRCIWPCRSDGDCRAGAACNAMLGTCVPAAQPTPGALPSASP